VGLLPLGFAILGGIACWKVWQARLFVIMGIGSLLISFGREGGLFWLLYQLPTMKSQRNPHRWSYFVALAVCVLAGYGADWLWKKLKAHRENRSKEQLVASVSHWNVWQKRLMIGTVFGAVLFAIAGLMSQDINPIAKWAAFLRANSHDADKFMAHRIVFGSFNRICLVAHQGNYTIANSR
jgi:hypothetical protein